MLMYALVLYYIVYICYTPLPWQRAGWGDQWSIFVIYVQLSDGFTDIRRVHGYMHKRLIDHPITTDNEVLNSYSPWTQNSTRIKLLGLGFTSASYYNLATVPVPGL